MAIFSYFVDEIKNLLTPGMTTLLASTPNYLKQNEKKRKGKKELKLTCNSYCHGHCPWREWASKLGKSDGRICHFWVNLSFLLSNR